MSLGEADAKFPGSYSVSPGLGPSPTPENPGGVYPKSDPYAAAPAQDRQNTGSPAYLGNPFLMHKAFGNLDHALGEVIHLLENEESAVSSSESESPVLRKFRRWRNELDEIRSPGKKLPASRSHSHSKTRNENEGGMFAD